jgi:hypothetical protein
MGRDFVDGDPVCDGCGQGRRFAGASARQHEDGSGVRSSPDLGFGEARGDRGERSSIVGEIALRMIRRRPSRFAGERRPFVISCGVSVWVSVECGVIICARGRGRRVGCHGVDP